MKSAVYGLLFLLMTSAEAKFSRGDQFQYSNINGNLTIQCGTKVSTVVCRDVFMDPWPYDIFLGPLNSKAESVEFRAESGNETQQTVVAYDGRTGRSAEVNLGVYSIFQKPLLKIGQNRILYSILDNRNNVLDKGLFVVNVVHGESRSCLPRQAFSSTPEDCDHPYSGCQSYFNDQNFCRK